MNTADPVDTECISFTMKHQANLFIISPAILRLVMERRSLGLLRLGRGSGMSDRLIVITHHLRENGSTGSLKVD